MKSICTAFFLLLFSLQAEVDMHSRQDLYLQALVTEKNLDKLNYILEPLINKSNEPEELNKLIILARNAGLTDRTLQALQKLLTIQPNNADALREAGIYSLRKNQFSQAKAYLSKYHQLVMGDTISHYYLSAAENWLKNYQAAYYHAILAEAHFPPSFSSQERDIYPSILRQQHRYLKGEETIRAINTTYDLPRFERIAFVSYLLFLDHVKEARYIFEKYLMPIDLQTVDDELKIEIQLTEVRLLIAEGKLRQAHELVDQVILDDADHTSAPSLKAGIYNLTGHWRKERALINETIEKAPQDEDLYRRQRFNERTYNSFMDGEFSYRFNDESDSQFKFRYQVEERFSDLWSLGVINRLSYASLSDVYDRDGRLEDKSGWTFNHTIYSQWDRFNGERIRLELHLPYQESDFTNTGTSYNHLIRLDNGGAWFYGFDYRKPYEGIIDGILDQITRDRLFLTKSWLVSNKIRLELTASANRYGDDDYYRTGDSLGANFNISYRLSPQRWQYKWFGDRSTFYLNYQFDYEDFIFIDEQTAFNGAKYNPIDHEDRQLHNFNILWFREFNKQESLEVYLGYSYDLRAHEHGPSTGWVYRYLTPAEVEIRIFGSHALTTELFTTIGLGIKWNF